MIREHKQSLFPIGLIAVLFVAAPYLALAHGGVDDGHVEDVATAATLPPSGGASALLQAFSPEWWGLLFGAAILTTLLSFGVVKYLHVPPVKKAEVTPAEAPAVAEKKA